MRMRWTANDIWTEPIHITCKNKYICKNIRAMTILSHKTNTIHEKCEFYWHKKSQTSHGNLVDFFVSFAFYSLNGSAYEIKGFKACDLSRAACKSVHICKT